MVEKEKTPKPKKPRKPRATQTQIVTVNVTAPVKAKRKRKSKAKRPVGFDPRAVGVSGPVGTINSGLTPVIYAPGPPKQDDPFLDDAFKKYIKNLYTQQPQQNPLLPPSASAPQNPLLGPSTTAQSGASAQPGTPAQPTAPPNVPRLGGGQTPASPLAPPIPKPSQLAASKSDISRASTIQGDEMSLAGDAIKDQPIDALPTADDMFIGEVAKQKADQSRVKPGPKAPTLEDLMKPERLSRSESDASSLTTDEGGTAEPPKQKITIKSSGGGGGGASAAADKKEPPKDTTSKKRGPGRPSKAEKAAQDAKKAAEDTKQTRLTQSMF